MKRFAMDWLEQWKKGQYRKPVIIEGVHGVGKTWLMKEFGEKEYEDWAYIDLGQRDERLNRLFAGNLDVESLVSGLNVYTGKDIAASNTLIILDNVQEMPKALNSLRYFYEGTQDYHVICASSMINIMLHKDVLTLAGKVEVLRLYPMSFQEFFLETEKKEQLRSFLTKNNFKMTDIFKQNYLEALKYYCFVGGMPEAVWQFVKYGDLDKVREVQEHILAGYRQYFAEKAPSALRSRICTVWESIPHQLSKENKKFIYDRIQEGGRAKFYEEAIAWLGDHGLIHKVDRMTMPDMPLEDCDDAKTFKLFVADVGLLGCMMGLRQRMLSDENALFDVYHGALTEQYVLQQIASIPGWNIHYYANERSACEISCLMDNGRIIVPVDIMTKVNLKAKRLQTYMDKFHPVKSVQISMMDYDMGDQILFLPLYAVEKIIVELGE